jgi:hypothetical protein
MARPTKKEIKEGHKTPLLQWLRHATPEMREQLAEQSGVSSLTYLYKLAGLHRENPRVRLALSIVRIANRIRDKAPDEIAKKLPVLTIEDMANPTRNNNKE